MSFEDAIIGEIVKRFFDPVPSGTSPDGQVYYSSAPAWDTALKLFEARKQEILGRVNDKLDVNALAEKIAKQVIAHLTANPPRNSWRSPQEEADETFKKDLREKVIDLLAEEQAAVVRAQLAAKPA